MVIVGGEKRLKFVDVPTEVTEDLPRVRREIEATIDQQNWPVMGEKSAGYSTTWNAGRSLTGS